MFNMPTTMLTPPMQISSKARAAYPPEPEYF